ncbi:hypothetical protein ACLESO_26600 [Pyxidicoccus sp. 3LG]
MLIIAAPLQMFHRFRAWAARLVLVVACLGTVATSAPRSPSVTAEYAGGWLSVSTGSPPATRHVVVRVTISEELEQGHLEGTLFLEATARWTPTDATRPERPWLRGALSDDFDTVGVGREVVLEPGVEQVVLPSEEVYLGSCKPTNRVCEWTGRVDFELQPGVGEGTAEVEWKVKAEMFADNNDDLPKGFRVEVLEP